MEATRERKLAFIGANFAAILIDVIDTEGASFFTDEQINKLTERMVRYERRRVRRNIENRAIARRNAA